MQSFVGHRQVGSRRGFIVVEQNSVAASLISIAIGCPDRLNKWLLHHTVCIAGCVTQQKQHKDVKPEAYSLHVHCKAKYMASMYTGVRTSGDSMQAHMLNYA